MRITIAGGSGFLGRALSANLLESGHDLVVLTRGAGTAAAKAGVSARRVTWTPDGSAGPWLDAIEGSDAVMNLAGESIGEGRWTEARKAAILESRILATRSLVRAITQARRPPRILISASAQGYYGERGDEELTEEAPPGTGFLARVCTDWEAEARKVGNAARLVLFRTGLVLSADEGALPRMLTPFRMFGGGPLGSGRQWISWIHWRDWVGMATWALDNDLAEGPLNVSAPGARRNREFSAAIGRALHRPSWLPAPAFALRAMLGEMADSLLFTSIRMVPRRAMELGYRFRFADLDRALQDLL